MRVGSVSKFGIKFAKIEMSQSNLLETTEKEIQHYRKGGVGGEVISST